ncbi:MAG TPA: DUF1345 domain-containing protein [Puia sp.]|nr:DUF1345 domain-containing protein [Puia sp.]
MLKNFYALFFVSKLAPEKIALLKNNTTTNRFNRMPAANKLLIAFSACVITFFILIVSGLQMEWITRIMISWDVFSMVLILMSAVTFFTMKPRQIRLLVKNQDASRSVVFMIVLISTVSSLVGIFLLLLNKQQWLLNKYVETLIYISGVNFSWLLLHIIFTFRYAHLYYANNQSGDVNWVPALEIHNELNPDYLDFAYFSFVIGMTFQVSDISIVSRQIRRLALLHGLLSFLFNTVIVALSINVIIDLKS